MSCVKKCKTSWALVFARHSISHNDDDDDVRLNVLGCRADILGTNCNKLLKLRINGMGVGVGVASASHSACNYVRGAARCLLLVKNKFCC